MTDTYYMYTTKERKVFFVYFVYSILINLMSVYWLAVHVFTNTYDTTHNRYEKSYLFVYKHIINHDL